MFIVSCVSSDYDYIEGVETYAFENEREAEDAAEKLSHIYQHVSVDKPLKYEEPELWFLLSGNLWRGYTINKYYTYEKQPKEDKWPLVNDTGVLSSSSVRAFRKTEEECILFFEQAESLYPESDFIEWTPNNYFHRRTLDSTGDIQVGFQFGTNFRIKDNHLEEYKISHEHLDGSPVMFSGAGDIITKETVLRRVKLNVE